MDGKRVTGAAITRKKKSYREMRYKGGKRERENR